MHKKLKQGHIVTIIKREYIGLIIIVVSQVKTKYWGLI